MSFALLILAIVAFYWYYKKWGKDDFISSIKNGTKSFGKGFMQGMMEERIDNFKRKMNYYVIALLAKIAKSDGRVSEQEADMISKILDANAKDNQEREFLKTSFNEHKNNIDDAFFVAKEFIKEVPLPKNERLNVLNVLVFMALIDGDINSKKEELLKTIAKAFGVSEVELLNFINNIKNIKNTNSNKMDINQAYEILSLNQNANIQDVKKRYRELAKKYHPDVLNANNVSKEELEQGARNFQKVNEAYELIKKHLEK